MKSFLKRFGSALLAPFRRGLGLDGLASRIEHANAALNDLDAIMVSRFESTDDRIMMIHADVVGYRDGAADARDAMVNAAAQMGVEFTRIEEELVALRERMAVETAHRLLHESLAAGLPAVDQGVADLLNFAECSTGFRAEAGLWLNPSVVIEYTPGDVHVTVVNERIAEVPFVMASLAGLPPGSRILDVGAGESTVSLSLASLGYHVVAVDLNGYPFSHPDLEAVAIPLEDYEPEAPFDAVVCLSSIEHFGLGAYGPDSRDDEADVKAVERLRQLVRPGGRLVLTTPYGQAHVNSLERTYDDAGLTRLLAGWSEPCVTVVVKRDPTTWSRRDDGECVPADTLQVALVTAVAGT